MEKLQKEMDKLYGQPWTHEHMSKTKELNKLCYHEFENMEYGGRRRRGRSKRDAFIQSSGTPTEKEAEIV